MQKIFNFYEAQFIYFFFSIVAFAFGPIAKKPPLDLRPQRFIYTSIYLSFMVMSYILVYGAFPFWIISYMMR